MVALNLETSVSYLSDQGKRNINIVDLLWGVKKLAHI